MRKPPLPPAAINNGIIPLDALAFDIDGVVADIMTTFLGLARERYDCGHHLRYEDLTAFQLEDCLDLEAGHHPGPHPGAYRPPP